MIVASFNYVKTQGIAQDLITRFGQTCQLKRAGDLRPCTAVEIAYTPGELDGQVVWHGDRRFYVAPLGVDPPPDSQEDRLLWNGLEYRIVTVAPFTPTDVLQYYELQVRR